MSMNTNNNVTSNNNSVASTTVVECPSCHSKNFIKRGTTKVSRVFQCKDCGRSFSIRWEKLEGTEYANPTTSTNNTTSTPSINTEAVRARRRNIIDNTNTNNNIEETVIDFEDKNVDLILARAKKDKDGNFLLRIGSSAPVPVGSSTEELKNIINQNGGCRMAMTDTGIFVIKIAPTTKG